MFKSSKIIFFIIVLLLGFLVLVFFAFKQAKHLQRDPIVLMNRYYLLKESNPEAAKTALMIILRQDKDYLPALNELSQLYLKENNYKSALPLLRRLHELEPDNFHQTMQLAHMYYAGGEWQKAHILFEQLKEEQFPGIREDALKMLYKMASALPNYRMNAAAELKEIQPATFLSVRQIWLDYFYKIKTEHREQARELLSLLALMDPKNPLIQEEMGYILLENGEETAAIPYFLQAYNKQPSARLALQLAYLYLNGKDEVKAAQFFLLAARANDPQIKKAALRGYELVRFKQQEPLLQLPTPRKSLSEEQVWLDQFYLLKKKNKELAWLLIQKIINQYPNNITALKEGGFLAIDKGYRQEAIVYFTQAYNLTFAADIAMQLGYLYDETSNKYLAYRYFYLATSSKDKELELRAQNSLTNLAGLQTKALPEPYFGEIFFDPFSQSRFGLTVTPLYARLGIETASLLQTKAYLVFRQTEDNKSTNSGQLPQIYEDNVRIMGGGVQITPIPNFPLIAFAEAGAAYDLIYRNRERWRGDLRGGLMYYNEFGAKPAYYDRVKISADYYSTWYGDLIYFSRYDNNVIGTLRTHQGIRLMQYHSSMVNLYLTGRIIEDTRREFFNNIAEIGPGIGFIPSNRYRVEIRFEHIKGAYLPAGGSFNPYGKYYTNNTVQFLFYLKL